jgi:hypothetical protein
MPEQLQRPDQPTASAGAASLVITVIGNLGAHLLHHATSLPFPYEYMVSYGVAFLVGYRFPPKPAGGFRHYAFRVLTIITCFHAGLWAIPKMLDRFLWTPAAYALPAFAFMILGYWVKPLYPTNKKQSKFWIWLLCAAAFAIIYAWAAVKSLDTNR